MKSRVVLASTSPRRHEILKKLNIEFEVVAPDFEEDMSHPLTPDVLAIQLAKGKAMSVERHIANSVVIAADTFVTHAGRNFGKPSSDQDARRSLMQMNGQLISIFTGYFLFDNAPGQHQFQSGCVETQTQLLSWSQREIDEYIASGEARDKAGGVGLPLVDHFVSGDIDSALGLPLREVARALEKFGIPV